MKGSDEYFPEDQYDVVFSNYVLHWIKDKASTFKKVHQNLKPGGRFAFTVPDGIPSLQLCDLMGPDISRQIQEETNYFIPLEEYEMMAKQYEFSVDFKAVRDTMSFPNIKVMIDWWFAANSYDPTLVDPVSLQSFVKPFGDKPVEFQVYLGTFILMKQ